MSTIEITEGTLHIFTFKAGLLSTIAHDLRLTVPHFTLDIDGENVRGRAQMTEIIVDGAMKRGVLQPRGLSDKDKADVRENIAKDVLKSATYPQVSFEGTAPGGVRLEGPAGPDASSARFTVSGQLEIVGRKQPISFSVERRGGRLLARAELLQSRWGIKPFKAMLGTLKVQDRIELTLDIADPTLVTTEQST